MAAVDLGLLEADGLSLLGAAFSCGWCLGGECDGLAGFGSILGFEPNLALAGGCPAVLSAAGAGLSGLWSVSGLCGAAVSAFGSVRAALAFSLSCAAASTTLAVLGGDLLQFGGSSSPLSSFGLSLNGGPAVAGACGAAAGALWPLPLRGLLLPLGAGGGGGVSGCSLSLGLLRPLGFALAAAGVAGPVSLRLAWSLSGGVVGAVSLELALRCAVAVAGDCAAGAALAWPEVWSPVALSGVMGLDVPVALAGSCGSAAALALGLLVSGLVTVDLVSA